MKTHDDVANTRPHLEPLPLERLKDALQVIGGQRFRFGLSPEPAKRTNHVFFIGGATGLLDAFPSFATAINTVDSGWTRGVLTGSSIQPATGPERCCRRAGPTMWPEPY